jgi:hypothetical protein
MNMHQLYTFFLRYFRTRRMRQFAEAFKLRPETRVLDVGGTPYNWSLLPFQPRLTILNITAPPDRSGADYLVADGRQLPFRDGEFDIVYNNSVIEHLGDYASQRRFAAECRRVGRSYYVQTPNRNFFFEPHYIAPFIHWLPKAIRRRLVRYATLRGWMTRPSQAQVDALVAEIRLLNERELRELFPDATIWRERFAGLTKSLMAVGATRAGADHRQDRPIGPYSGSRYRPR